MSAKWSTPLIAVSLAALSAAQEVDLPLPTGVEVPLVFVPAGEFPMGNDEGLADHQHDPGLLVCDDFSGCLPEDATSAFSGDEGDVPKSKERQ